jgi:hypothetical protein
VHDVLLFYGKTNGIYFSKQFVRYADEYAESRFRLVDEKGRRYQEQNLSNPSLRPNLFYPYKASNGITYHPIKMAGSAISNECDNWIVKVGCTFQRILTGGYA